MTNNRNLFDKGKYKVKKKCEESNRQNCEKSTQESRPKPNKTI